MEGLESKIQQHIGSGEEDSGEDFGKGLVCKLLINNCECLFKYFVLFYMLSADGFKCVHYQKPMRMFE